MEIKMKTLICYYSWSGNNRKLAQELGKKLGADLDEIIDLKDRKGIAGFLRSAFLVLAKKQIEIKTSNKNPKDYDLLILVTPIQIGGLPSASRTYLSQNKNGIKNLAIASVSGMGKRNKSIIKDITMVFGKNPKIAMLLSTPDLKSNYQKKIEEFINNLK